MPFLGGRGQASRGYFGGGTTPGAPTSLVATRGNTEISVAFSAPVFNGGLDITNYEYSLNAGSTWTALSPVDAASPVLITGLNNGTTYTVYLRAVNAIGSGTTSAPANAVTPAAVPGAPGTPTPTAHENTQVPLSWTAAASNGSGITDYVVEYSTSATFVGGGTVFADGTSASTSTTVTGLSNGTTYYFRVAAVNSVGTGSYSAISAGAVPSTVPSAPATPTITAADGGDTFNWTAPANGGRAITGYVYQISTNDGAFAAEVSVGAGVTSVAVGNQYSASTFKIKVRAVNANGSSGFSTTSANTAVWALGSMTDSGTCAAFTCSCGGCDGCGTNNGTNSTASGTRTCYRWTRAGSASSSLRNANGVDACSASYGSCTGGSCVSCSGCGTWNNVTENILNAPFAFAGTEFYTEYVPFMGYRAYVYDNYAYPYGGGQICPGWQYGEDTAYHLLYVCSVTGEQRVTFVGCSSVS